MAVLFGTLFLDNFLPVLLRYQLISLVQYVLRKIRRLYSKIRSRKDFEKIKIAFHGLFSGYFHDILLTKSKSNRCFLSPYGYFNPSAGIKRKWKNLRTFSIGFWMVVYFNISYRKFPPKRLKWGSKRASWI